MRKTIFAGCMELEGIAGLVFCLLLQEDDEPKTAATPQELGNKYAKVIGHNWNELIDYKVPSEKEFPTKGKKFILIEFQQCSREAFEESVRNTLDAE